MFSERGIRILAEAKIEQAMREGKFDSIAGLGKPMDNDWNPNDPNWWIRQKIKSEQIEAYKNMERSR